MDRVAIDDPRLQDIAAEDIRGRLAGFPDAVVEPLVAAQLAAKFHSLVAQHPRAAADLIAGCGYRIVARSVREFRLCDIAVPAAERGRGYGALLLGDLLEEADAAGAAVVLSVWHDSPARCWYERHGFVAVGGDPHTYLEMRREYRSIHSVA